MAIFHFGVVLFKNSKEQVDRLYNSVVESCARANVVFDITFLENSENGFRNDLLNKAGVRKIDFTENLGFGRAHNAIVEQFEDDGYYVGLNPDGFLLPSSMTNALAWLSDELALYEFLQFPQEHPKLFDPMNGNTAWCSGAAFLIALPLFKSLGGFDDRFFMYCEDVDLSWRVYRVGGKCICMSNARFFHDVSDGRLNRTTIRNMLHSQVLLAHKWGDTFAATRSRLHLWLFCRRTGLSFPRIPRSLKPLVRRPPKFCDFGRRGSYSETRW